jgi:hypothetical protein
VNDGKTPTAGSHTEQGKVEKKESGLSSVCRRKSRRRRRAFSSVHDDAERRTLAEREEGLSRHLHEILEPDIEA